MYSPLSISTTTESRLVNHIHRMIMSYLDALSFEKGLSRNTIAAYRRDLEHFLDFLSGTGSNQLSFNLIQSYLESLASLKPASIARKKSCLKNYFIYLNQQVSERKENGELLGSESEIKIDFLDLFKTHIPTEFMPTVLTTEMVFKLINLAKNDRPCSWFEGVKGRTTEQDYYNYRYSYRDELIVKIFYALGVRVSELCGITTNDLLMEDDLIIIHGKGDKTRYLPLYDELKIEINCYLQKVRPFFQPKSHHLFLSRISRNFSRVGMWKLINALAKKLGVKLSPHSFRHTFATHMVQNGADIRTTQELLGHSSIKTTEKYTHLLSDDLQETLRQFHPQYER